MSRSIPRPRWVSRNTACQMQQRKKITPAVRCTVPRIRKPSPSPQPNSAWTHQASLKRSEKPLITSTMKAIASTQCCAVSLNVMRMTKGFLRKFRM